jgi:hypothetical protein
LLIPRHDEAVEKLRRMCYIGIKRDTWEYIDGNVKKVMKTSVKKQRKTSTSLPLEGGGRGWG